MLFGESLRKRNKADSFNRQPQLTATLFPRDTSVSRHRSCQQAHYSNRHPAAIHSRVHSD